MNESIKITLVWSLALILSALVFACGAEQSDDQNEEPEDPQIGGKEQAVDETGYSSDDDDMAAPETPIDETFSLRVGWYYKSPDRDLTIRFIGVLSDSRCPPKAICVWAGEATVLMGVAIEGESEVEFELTVGGRAYQIGDILVESNSLEPYGAVGFQRATTEIHITEVQ